MKSSAVIIGLGGVAAGAFMWPDLTWSITLLATSAILVLIAGALDYIHDHTDQRVADIVDLAEQRTIRQHPPYTGPLPDPFWVNTYFEPTDQEQP